MSRKGAKVFALVIGVSMLAAACGDDDDAGGGTDTTSEVAAETTAAPDTTEAGGDTTEAPDTTAATDAEAAAGGSMAYAAEQELDAYNNSHGDTNALKNALVLNQILPDTHNFNDKAELVLDEELMVSAEITSEDPQVVEYVVNPDAVWSDGDPIDCDDFQLTWVSQNGKLQATNPDGTPATDEEGNPLPLFVAAGTTGYEQIDTVECSEDGKTITTTYAEPFADWKSLFSGILPAHILEAQAGVPDIEAAVASNDTAALNAAAEFWNSGWVLNPGDLALDITPSGDAYVWSTWEPGSQVTLVRNENFWGTPGNLDEIVFRFIAQDAQAQALANGEVHVMDPQPNPELKAQLDGMSGVVVTTGEEYTFEHLDFNFARPDMQIREVREAFAKCAPRQLIVDNLIKPQNPEAIVLNNRLTYSFEDRYQDNSGGLYDEVDIEGARALLQSVGKEGMPLQLNSNGNPRRLNEIALIKDSCDQAGFVVEDLSDPTFFDAAGGLAQGDFDVALFAWTGSPLVTSSSSTYVTNGGNNNGKYSNPEVDTLLAELNSTIDEAAQLELVNQIDTILWEDLATIPIFTFPAIEAHAENTENVIFNPTQQGMTWNAHQWAISQ